MRLILQLPSKDKILEMMFDSAGDSLPAEV